MMAKMFMRPFRPEDETEAEVESEEVSEPLLRSMSESQPVPFRRQMYRKDI